jgi:hypothetical protein
VLQAGQDQRGVQGLLQRDGVAVGKPDRILAAN